MKIELRPGKYVAAVSGGVDSAALLHILHKRIKKPAGSLVVAHFDHGIREDSAQDRKFVEKLAKNYGLEFYYEEARLGTKASEALARKTRYEFLGKVKNRTSSDAIITAHHQDDVLETLVINLLRGTGRKGLSSLSDRPGLARPLLKVSKAEIIKYAQKNKLKWHEDETNQDPKYLRNRIRHTLMKKLSEKDKRQLLEIIRSSKTRNRQIDELITGLFFKDDGIAQGLFAGLSHNVSSEVIAQWLRREDIRLDKKTVERLVIKLKTAREGAFIQANRSKFFVVEKGIIRMKTP